MQEAAVDFARFPVPRLRQHRACWRGVDAASPNAARFARASSPRRHPQDRVPPPRRACASTKVSLPQTQRQRHIGRRERSELAARSRTARYPNTSPTKDGDGGWSVRACSTRRHPHDRV